MLNGWTAAWMTVHLEPDDESIKADSTHILLRCAHPPISTRLCRVPPVPSFFSVVGPPPHAEPVLQQARPVGAKRRELCMGRVLLDIDFAVAAEE